MPTGRDHRSPGEDAAPGSPRGLLHGLAPRRRDVQTIFISRGRYQRVFTNVKRDDMLLPSYCGGNRVAN